MTASNIESSKAISYGWASVKKDFWYLIGIAVVSAVIGGIGSGNSKSTDMWDFIGFLLSAWIMCGYTKMMLEYQAGKKLPFASLFGQYKYFWRILGANILLGVIIGVGFVLLIVPGVYLALRFQFVIQLIVDKDLGIIAAMKESTRLTDGKKMSLLMFNIVLLGIAILGAICLGVGVFVAMPVIWLATVVVYRQLAGTQSAVTAKPATTISASA